MPIEAVRFGEPVRGVERQSGDVTGEALQKVDSDSIPERLAKHSGRIKNAGEIIAQFGIGRIIDILA
jgi:hypothetical protein